MDILKKYFSEFSDTQLKQFEALGPLYQEWNEKINVISRKDIESLYERHILHSLAIAAIANFPKGCQVFDLGTGGGFPGLPLAIFFPEVRFLLVDSIGKKLKVIDAIAEEIGLQNVTTRHTRVEDIKDRKADYIVSRAVAPLGSLWRWSKPLLKKSIAPDPEREEEPMAPGLICLKGGDLHQEIQESGTRPRMMNVRDIFEEEFFQDKYILYVPR